MKIVDLDLIAEQRLIHTLFPNEYSYPDPKHHCWHPEQPCMITGPRLRVRKVLEFPTRVVSWLKTD